MDAPSPGHHLARSPSLPFDLRDPVTQTPHYLRFARSLALVGVGGSLVVACGGTTNTPDDAFTPPSPDAFVSSVDAFVSPSDDAFAGADAPVATDAPILMAVDTGAVPDDAFDMCAACVCIGPGGGGGGDDAGRPDCNTVPGSEICCAAIGPLSPPDLAV